MVFTLAYISWATRPWSDSALLELLEQSSADNLKCRITGMLVHQDGRFLQVLEGQPERVGELYTRIRADRRHRDVTTLLEESVAKREFPQWSMGYRTLDGSRTLQQCADDVRAALAVNRSLECPSRALKLLVRFMEIVD